MVMKNICIVLRLLMSSQIIESLVWGWREVTLSHNALVTFVQWQSICWWLAGKQCCHDDRPGCCCCWLRDLVLVGGASAWAGEHFVEPLQSVQYCLATGDHQGESLQRQCYLLFVCSFFPSCMNCFHILCLTSSWECSQPLTTGEYN